MVIDTSAVVAILFDEPERAALVDALASVESTLLSAATFLECSIVVESRLGAEGVRDLDEFLSAASIEIMPVDAEQARVAREAYRRFGKGRHRAALNYGDCFSYALAKVEGRPLLFKGKDFSATDLTPFV